MHEKIQWYFFGGVLAIVGVLSFFIFQPFFTSIALAIFLALLFRPWYKKFLHLFRNRDRLAATTTVFAALLGIVTPLFFISRQLFIESQNVYQQLRGAQFTIAEQSLQSFEKHLRTYIPDFTLNVTPYIESVVGWVSSQLGGFVFGTLEGIFSAILILFLFYYFLRNGERITAEMVKLSPLPDAFDNEIVATIKRTIDSVLRGTMLIAIIQGVLVGVGLWIFDVPNPVIWGSIGALSALVPGVGTSLVLIPATLFLIFSDRIGLAFGLAIWGAVVVGLVDNFLIPLLYGKTIHIHPVFVLLAVLGGLSFFGFLGFIFGPIILSLLLVLLNMYRTYHQTIEKIPVARRKPVRSSTP